MKDQAVVDRPGFEKPRQRSMGGRLTRLEMDVSQLGQRPAGAPKSGGSAASIHEVNAYNDPFTTIASLIDALSQSSANVKGDGLVYYLNGGVTVARRIIRVGDRVMMESPTHGGLVDISVLGQGGEIT